MEVSEEKRRQLEAEFQQLKGGKGKFRIFDKILGFYFRGEGTSPERVGSRTGGSSGTGRGGEGGHSGDGHKRMGEEKMIGVPDSVREDGGGGIEVKTHIFRIPKNPILY